jgi:site-specific DNA-methyltransferase (adenine-specific)
MNTDIKFENCHVMLGDCLSRMKEIPHDSIDLTVTSPPYDNLRTYKGYSFDFEGIAKELYRITKEGGVVVWVVNDATIKGSETGTSFRQALYFKDVCGFNLHDTMIWNKNNFTAVGALQTRYAPVFEYMFILTKGKLKTFNPLIDRKNSSFGRKQSGTIRQVDGTTKPLNAVGSAIKEFGQRHNVWVTPPEMKRDINHPAPFPEKLANDHILSWSNECDTVFDPFTGSGTTAKMSLLNNRKFIGCEIAEEYMDIISERLKEFYNR